MKLGGFRIFQVEKEKLLEIMDLVTHIFWRDVLKGLYIVKPVKNMKIHDILSLDILNFAPVHDIPNFVKWKEKDMECLIAVIDKKEKKISQFRSDKSNS